MGLKLQKRKKNELQVASSNGSAKLSILHSLSPYTDLFWLSLSIGARHFPSVVLTGASGLVLINSCDNPVKLDVIHPSVQTGKLRLWVLHASYLVDLMTILLWPFLNWRNKLDGSDT